MAATPCTRRFPLDLRNCDRPATAARRHVTTTLAGLGSALPASVVDDAELVASELIANAVRHTRSGPLDLELTVSTGYLTVSVRDADPRLPVFTPAATSDESGRGLGIVQALSSAQGYQPQLNCKTVWATLIFTQAPAGAAPDTLQLHGTQAGLDAVLVAGGGA